MKKFGTQFLLVALLAISFVGCSKDEKHLANPSNGGGGGGGSSPAGGGGGSGGAGGGATGCRGTYRFDSGMTWQTVTLYDGGICEIINNAGVAESSADCRYVQSGTSLGISSRGVSVTWSIAASCATLTPDGVTVFNKL